MRTQAKHLPGWRSPAWMGLFGVLLALSAPGYNLWPLAWLALIPALAWTRQPKSAREIFNGSFWHGFAYHGAFCLWFFDLHPLTWYGFSEWGSRLVTLAGWLIIAVEGGLLGGLLMLAYRKLRTDSARLLLFPPMWVLGFALLNCTPMALPWALLENSQAGLWPMRALAHFLGGSGIAALLIFHNVLWEVSIAKKWLIAQAGRLLLPLALPVLITALILFPPNTPTQLPGPVAVVQADLPIEVIRSGDLRQELIDRTYLQPIRQANFTPGTLLVYPEEGVVSGWVSLRQPEQNPSLAELIELSRQKKLAIAVGISSADPLGRAYNSIALISPDGQPLQFYHKRRLVPFGEFTPYSLGRPLTQLLAALGIGYSALYEQGTQAPLLRTGPFALGGLVCFELIDTTPGFGGYANQYAHQGANMLINTSNLGWFHQNPLIEAQFLANGQMRAAESGLPLVIASNTGISAVIGPGGQVLLRAPLQGASSHKTQILLYNRDRQSGQMPKNSPK